MELMQLACQNVMSENACTVVLNNGLVQFVAAAALVFVVVALREKFEG
jgi:hypothetical protein